MAEGKSTSRTTAKQQEIEELNLKQKKKKKMLAKQQGVTVETQIVNGSILETLLDYSDKHGIDMIAVGAQGHGLLDKLPLGSVPHGLISLAQVPVLVVKK